MPPFRLNVPNLPADLPPAPSNPKKRRKNAPIQPPPSVQDLLPPPLSGYGDTIVASNPFDDCPSNVNTGSSMGRPHGGPPMGMGGPGPNMVMGNNMGMYRPMCPNPSMGMNSPMMHSPNAHQMNNSMMMNGPRMAHMGPGPGHGPPHMMPSPNGPGGGGPMGPNMSMTEAGRRHVREGTEFLEIHRSGTTQLYYRGKPPNGTSNQNQNMYDHIQTGPPMHSPLGNMGPMPGQGPGNASPMSHSGPMNGGGMNNPMNGPPMGGPQMAHGPHGPHGGPGPGPGMNMSSGNGPPVGPPMNNNFIMSPMNNMYSKPMPVSAGKVYPVDQPMVFNSQNPNAPPIYPCGVCHKEVHDNDQAILCESGCNFWFHRGCTGLTEAAFQLLTAEVYAEWVCDKCLHSKNIPLVKFKP